MAKKKASAKTTTVAPKVEEPATTTPATTKPKKLKRATTTKILVALSVDIEVLSPDQLKKFIFGISKTREDDKENWTVDFFLFVRDRKADNFVQQIKIAVALSLKHVPVAEATALRDMTVKQKNYVNTMVTAAADSLEAGEITEEQFEKIVARTFRKR